ncbi:TenA family protein [Phytoactinopolyspora endophytica]|uniref:TenA family protein n=1 Tax=Phytoactinopolyspora endophytica TaxID=1642495 RepID=UPI00101C550A|nr:TenA family protein [Phytoactinopolyspora endophytica]
MGFSADAWERAKPWYDAILEHPFVRGLGDGTLDREVFLRYIVDDAHYLARYSRALATTAARWPEPEGAASIARFAAGAVDAERMLHASLLSEAGVDVDKLKSEPTPTCLAYVHTLLADASVKPAPVALAGLLPCFRIYAEVGRHLADVLVENPGHPYAAWLSAYGDPAFAEDTRRAEELVDQQAPDDGPELDQMHEAYAQASRFEWMFWDASYRGESWPTP